MTHLDHRYICFNYGTTRVDTTTIRRNPKHTDWVNYSKDLKILLGDPKCKLNSTLDIELEADRLSKTITQAWTDNCPAKEIKPKKVPWWNKELEALKRETRIAFNRAKARKDYSDYSKKLTEYHKAVRKSKRKSWTDHCGLISSLPESMRLTKALSLAKESPLTSIKNKNGKLTESGEETLRIMATEHFPGSTIINIMTDEDLTHSEVNLIKTSRAEWNTARKIVDGNLLKWAIDSFKPYKSPGPDGIYPILLQKGSNVLIPHLVNERSGIMTVLVEQHR
ncbi:uncharacterized protein LOC142976822 [Anticarsia gemmatalis]|uniref:uncharacterized protein LOC142976822 n=1 Tax=Anticarsia gemmatalis TaxID=129554 RepID=UPI003F75FBD5